MINGVVMFWPAGTTWDAKNRLVRFGGEFQGTAPAPVDAHFTGGGGVWDAGDDLRGVVDKDSEAAIRHCMATIGTTAALFVYPART